MFTFDEIDNFEDYETALDATEDDGIVYDEATPGISL